MKDIAFDEADRRILRAIGRNGRMTIAELSQEVSLSASPCWRRLKKLEDSGVVTGYPAAFDRRKLGWSILAFVRVSIEDHEKDAARSFEKAVMLLEEVTACWSISGDADFLLQVVAEDMDAYGQFAMQCIRKLPGIRSMSTSFVLQEHKSSERWPIR